MALPTWSITTKASQGDSGPRLEPDQRIPAEQARKQHGVAQAGNREQLGDALQQTKRDGLKPADGVDGGQLCQCGLENGEVHVGGSRTGVGSSGGRTE